MVIRNNFVVARQVTTEVRVKVVCDWEMRVKWLDVKALIIPPVEPTAGLKWTLSSEEGRKDFALNLSMVSSFVSCRKIAFSLIEISSERTSPHLRT